jgi:hypothetical protein
VIPGLSPADTADLNRLLAEPDLAVQAFFRIKDLTGQVVDLRYNRAQQATAQRSADSSFQYVIKARKLGISSRRFALDLLKCATRRNEHRVLLTHTDDAADKLLALKIRPLLTQCKIPLGGVPRQDHIYFPATDSRYYIGTAGSRSFGRGDDITGYHFSEYAHWERPDVAGGVEEALVDGADGLIETTANGHNFAKADWEKAKRGENRYRAIFLPWFLHEAYDLPGQLLDLISADEQKLMAVFGLTQSQIAWRREKLRTMRDPALFPQEYPATDEEAFLSSGRPVFDWVSLVQARALVSEPKFRGYLVRKFDRIEFIPEPKGNLSVWKLPEPGHVYAVGSDVAEGLEGGAYSTGEVLDIGDGEQVAEWHGHIAPDLLAEVLELLSEWYHHGVIVPESWPGPGSTTTSHLEQRRARLWRGPDALRSGFETTSASKPLMVRELAAALRDHRFTPRSKRLLAECQSYVYTPKGAMEPSLGNFSDCLMGMGIVWYATRDLAARVDYYRAPRPDFASQAVSTTMATAPKWRGNLPGVRPTE